MDWFCLEVSIDCTELQVIHWHISESGKIEWDGMRWPDPLLHSLDLAARAIRMMKAAAYVGLLD